MRNVVFGAVAAAFVLALGSVPVSAQDLRAQIEQGCETELKSHCSKVTPGEGRLLACLYAHSDKLSGQCEFALYEASVRLERAIAALTYVAKECDDDIDKMCANVAVGDGRVVACLEDNSKKLSKTCKRALTDVGLME